ncbi:hypothetical protein [Pedobacter heparinus]|uniref:Uncharacterized protein n=1 Tax=Pedobacter heparinus (strain ATCC 13125 / DSM 2366 / CIP 104194 / JCM 7457 / NBRC 12017 / NCIMB 9290 / NRRL B-14731 / HIM 762-3) TaxID=485917 RepID=C6Y3Q5_PEDHD|nr:hypothetical protein [Pedobacter heparinus]ACU03334.1 hypothetical protein Phep_1116 [Pedobacter heparinus DSM 2366]
MSNQNSPVVENHLVRIGVLLIDMQRDLIFEIDNEQLVFLECEFIRIQEAVTQIWAEKPIGLSYFLSFHLAEARRLKNQIKIKELLKNKPEMTDTAIFRLNVYTLLRYSLNDLIRLLNKLIKGEGIHLKMD